MPIARLPLRALVLSAVFALAGCGWTPLYADR